jgi:hypothetical protein
MIRFEAVVWKLWTVLPANSWPRPFEVIKLQTTTAKQSRTAVIEISFFITTSHQIWAKAREKDEQTKADVPFIPQNGAPPEILRGAD